MVSASRLHVVGREITRAALYVTTARGHRRDRGSTAPTLERFRHGQSIEGYDGAVMEAGARGHRVVEACLLDRLRERGIFGKGEVAMLRQAAGLWLRGLFHDSGLMRPVTMRLESAHSHGDPTRAAVFEKSFAASRALASYQAAVERVETMAGDRRAAELVREIACWDRLPLGAGVGEIGVAFDMLVEAMEAVGVGE